MNSDVMTQNYARSDQLKYGGHYAILASEKITYENPTGEFVMVYATTNAPTSSYDKTLPKNSTSNVINDDNLGVGRITASNYINLTVPKHYFYITKLEIETNTYGCGMGGLGGCDPKIIITRKEYYKGQKFVVLNAGGQVDTPCVVGVV